MVRCYYETNFPAYLGEHRTAFHHVETTPAGVEVEVWKCLCGQLTWNWPKTKAPNPTTSS